MSLKYQSTFVDPTKVRKLFEKYDLDRNGFLDEKEFIKVMVDILKELGESLPEKKHIELAEEGFQRFDFNSDHKIEFNELIQNNKFLIITKKNKQFLYFVLFFQIF